MRPGPNEVRDMDWALGIVSRLERDDRYQAWEAAHVLADAIERVIAFCEDRRVEAVNGGRTDADTVWPSDVLRVLRGERPYA